MTEEPLIDAAEASRLLGVKRSTVHKYEERGKLVPIETRYEGLRRKPMFRRSDVEKLRPQSTEETESEYQSQRIEIYFKFGLISKADYNAYKGI